jgi:uncharacterized surface anchored protein
MKNKNINAKKLYVKIDKINKRLAEIRQAILNENISYGEIAELQSICRNPLYCPYDDPLLLEWGGVLE